MQNLCNVCGLPKERHTDGLFCCTHCSGIAKKEGPTMIGEAFYNVRCSTCGISTGQFTHYGSDNCWNKRAV